jgi:hypothetical protein
VWRERRPPGTTCRRSDLRVERFADLHLVCTQQLPGRLAFSRQSAFCVGWEKTASIGKNEMVDQSSWNLLPAEVSRPSEIAGQSTNGRSRESLSRARAELDVTQGNPWACSDGSSDPDLRVMIRSRDCPCLLRHSGDRNRQSRVTMGNWGQRLSPSRPARGLAAYACGRHPA